MVFNHSSDEHPWFKESRKSRDNPYRDFYFWRDPVDGKPPTNWPSVYGGSGWEYDGVTGQYYLHHYAVKQPDLNWESAKVREELYAVLNFWADRGASGFRFDCAGEISKPLPFRDLPNGSDDDLLFRTSGARLHEYFKEMRAATQKYPDLYFVGEGWGMSRQRILESTDPENKELDSAFRMDFALDNIGGDWQDLPWSLSKLKEFNAENSFPDAPEVWPVVFIEDHDFARSVSRYGSHRPEFIVRSAKLLAMMVLSLRGTPFIYQGEELGMSDFPFKDITQYDDISVHNDWRDLVEMGKVPPAEYLANIAHVSRDNSRTPMHWDDSSNAGFTSATPWLAVNPNYPSINVRSEAADPASMLTFFKKMARIRQASKALMLGTYTDISAKDSRVYAYLRSNDREHRAVILNFSDDAAVYEPPQGVVLRTRLLSNVDGTLGKVGKSIQLPPWAAVLMDSAV
jgi:oligo-1,6-glucosidase